MKTDEIKQLFDEIIAEYHDAASGLIEDLVLSENTDAARENLEREIADWRQRLEKALK